MSSDPAFPQSNGRTVPPAVIGLEMAAATEAERRRLARGDSGPSPMPDGSYHLLPKERLLLNPVKQPLDTALAELCHTYVRADETERARMRGAISTKEFYRLLGFGRRAAVFALREQSVAWVTDALTAIAMVDSARIDYRDLLVDLSIVYHAAQRLTGNGDGLLAEAAQVAGPVTARLLQGFINRPPETKTLVPSWGYAEIETEDGVAFISRGFKPYHPRYDLARIVLDIAGFVSTDTYQATEVTIAESFPRVWLETPDNAVLDRVLKGIRAVATTRAQLLPSAHPRAESQMFSVFIVETASDEDALSLLRLAKPERPGYAMLGLAKSDVFLLVIARSYVDGVESFETTESLARFADGLTTILRRHIPEL